VGPGPDQTLQAGIDAIAADANAAATGLGLTDGDGG
jgi:hypothetical protein